MEELIKVINNICEQCDYRQQTKVKYPLSETIFLLLSGMIANCENIEQVLIFGNTSISFLREYFPYKNGIPALCTIYRLLDLINPLELGNLLIMMKKELKTSQISIDGKYAKNSKCKRNTRTGSLIVSAYDNENEVTITQEIVPSKTNEIPTVYEILKRLNLNGTIITVDSLNSQVKNSDYIIHHNGNYIFPIKENHENLYKVLEDYFDDEKITSIIMKDTNRYFCSINKSNSKIHKREYFIGPSDIWTIENQLNKDEWIGVKQVVKCIYTATNLKTNEQTIKIRYFISSVEKSAKEYSVIIKDHWKVETMHWYLDVTFREDDCTVSHTNAVENLNIFRKTALALIKKYKKETKRSVKNYRYQLSQDKELLKELLEHYI